MIKHMKLGDMPQFCETVKAWLNERYGEEQGAAIWRATAAQHPAAFHTVTEPYDWENRAARYCFTQCPNAEFAKKHNLLHVLPLFCNSDYWAIRQLHGTLIRCGTCGNAEKCDYCVVGSESALAKQYEIVKDENGFLVSRKKD